MLQCCGAPAHWAGSKRETDPAIALLRENWQQLGKPQLIVACSSCLEMVGTYLPEMDTISLWEVLDRCELPQGATRFETVLEATPNSQYLGMIEDGASAKGNGIGNGIGSGTESEAGSRLGQTKMIQMAIHDPCTTRHAPKIQSAARSLAGKLGIQLQELELGREKTECCGFGGLMQNANPEMAKKQIEQRAAQSDLDYLVYCAVCRESLRGSGKRSAHLLDFLFPEQNKIDPATRARIGISERRDNRMRLKQHFQEIFVDDSPGRPSDLGKEKNLDTMAFVQKCTEDEKDIQLHIEPEVAVKLEDRRILHDDIRQVIAHAEGSNQKMQSEVSGHF